MVISVENISEGARVKQMLKRYVSAHVVDMALEKEQELVLIWDAAGQLAPDEWYAVRLNWLQNGVRAFGGTNVKETFWIVPPEQYYGLADLGTGRVYEWQVFIEKVTTNQAGEKTGLPVSPPSESRIFFWP